MNWLRSTTARVLVLAVGLTGCVSTSPRPFMPVLQPPATDQAALEREFQACAAQVAAGEGRFGGNVTTAVVGGAGVLATGEVVGGAVLATAWGAAGAGALAATGVGMVILLPLGTLQMSRSRRAHNERDVQTAMAACMDRAGYHVASWTRVSPQDAAAGLRTPTHHTRPAT